MDPSSVQVKLGMHLLFLPSIHLIVLLNKPVKRSRHQKTAMTDNEINQNPLIN